ncbi:MAG: hypothetical protein CMM93_06635 [Rickettsiales bacterium]|nr:hypothetical protein [Rickettsiales bacterium]|tara:strand:+ start:2534 stop:2968 length:435 start_codon:yes stop_codon:yes gene_type:complete
MSAKQTWIRKVDGWEPAIKMEETQIVHRIDLERYDLCRRFYVPTMDFSHVFYNVRTYYGIGRFIHLLPIKEMFPRLSALILELFCEVEKMKRILYQSQILNYGGSIEIVLVNTSPEILAMFQEHTKCTIYIINESTPDANIDPT